MSKEFWPPAHFEFEIKGFFEEFIDDTTKKMLGIRILEEPTRPLGSDGILIYDLTETLTLKKGLKEVVVKASPQKPVRVIAMIQVLCGRHRSSK